MTTTLPHRTRRFPRPTRSTGDMVAPERRLRTVLALNAATSGAFGLVGLVGASWVTEQLGLPSPTWTRMVAALLVLFALAVGLVATRAGRRLHAGVLAISAVDLAWVAATAAVIATFDLTTVGTAIAAVQGLGVLGFAAIQLWLRRMTTRGRTTRRRDGPLTPRSGCRP